MYKMKAGWITLIVFVAASVVGLGIYLVVNFALHKASLTKNTPPPTTTSKEPNNNKAHFVSRHEWLAQPPHKEPISKLSFPIQKVEVNDTKTEECFNQPSCFLVIRNLQSQQMITENDIAFNFLVGGDGEVYEGRGWNARAKGVDSDTLVVAVIGNFSERHVNATYLNALNRFLVNAEGGLVANKISFKMGIDGTKKEPHLKNLPKQVRSEEGILIH